MVNHLYPNKSGGGKPKADCRDKSLQKVAFALLDFSGFFYVPTQNLR